MPIDPEQRNGSAPTMSRFEDRPCTIAATRRARALGIAEGQRWFQPGGGCEKTILSKSRSKKRHPAAPCSVSLLRTTPQYTCSPCSPLCGSSMPRQVPMRFTLLFIIRDDWVTTKVYMVHATQPWGKEYLLPC